MATVPRVTSGSGLRKFQADGFLFDIVYNGKCCRVSLDTELITVLMGPGSGGKNFTHTVCVSYHSYNIKLLFLANAPKNWF